MILTSIDPGKDTGWATWHDCMLSACGLSTDGDPPIRGGDLVIEKPQIYRAPRSKGDPNDLIDVAILVGSYIERAKACNAFARITKPTPGEWKGQVPKRIHHKRVLAALTPPELAIAEQALKCIPKGDQHNTLDAIGLGLWELGRLDR